MPELVDPILVNPTQPPLVYPGKLIKKDFPQPEVVKAVQRRLNELGCGPLLEDGQFGAKTEKAVRIFQLKFTDPDGLPLKVDGVVGSITWVSLFGQQSMQNNVAPDPDQLLLRRVLFVAGTQVGIKEVPPGSNRGPRVDEYVTSVGLNPAGKYPWCVAFVYWCFDKASKDLGLPKNPMIKTAGVIDHWNKAGAQGIPRITASKARNNPALVKPGHIFCVNLGSGFGHTGLVEQVVGGKLITIEGNTNEGGSREGIGVFRRSLRKIADIDLGFINYGK